MIEDKAKIKIYSTREERLAEYHGSDRVISSHDFKKELDEAKDKPSYSFLTQIPSLDKYTEGFETGELIVISGYTGHGKTSLCQSFTTSFAKQGINTLWFSYEMPPRQFFAKFPNELPLFYLPREVKDKALIWLEDRIIEAKIKFNTRAIVIDHLHFLIDLVQGKHPSLEIGTIVRALKQLAMRHNVVIFLIAHTSMPKGDKEPGLEDIRDSSFITQEADAAMVIHRIRPKGKKIYGNEAEITILKHRRMGTMGKVIRVFYKDKQFYEVDQNLNDQD